MASNTFDARGQLCPKPLIMMKKALKKMKSKESATLLMDNETSKDNVERFLKDNQINFVTEKNDNEYILSFSASDIELKNPNAKDYCSISPRTENRGGSTYSFKSQYVGIGDNDLGGLLVRGFIATLKSLETLPKSIVMYNSAVKLVLDGSSVVDDLKELDELGVKILVCGTCIDHYDVKNKVRVGLISNALDIMEEIEDANKVIYP